MSTSEAAVSYLDLERERKLLCRSLGERIDQVNALLDEWDANEEDLVHAGELTRPIHPPATPLHVLEDAKRMLVGELARHGWGDYPPEDHTGH